MMDTQKLDTFEQRHAAIEEQLDDLEVMLEQGLITPKQYTQMSLLIAQAPSRNTTAAAKPVRE
jgi:predicted RNA-binding protein associated with RNAse of E/G family